MEQGHILILSIELQRQTHLVWKIDQALQKQDRLLILAHSNFSFNLVGHFQNLLFKINLKLDSIDNQD